MKTEIVPTYPFFGKRRLNCAIAFIFCMISLSHPSTAQCPGGYTSATINWDNLDYIHNRGGVYSATNPVSGSPFVSAAMWQTQQFAIGTSSMTIATTIPVGVSGSTYGELTTHTGETGAYGTGADLSFVKTGTAASTITLTFSTEVKNLQFSVFDIDQEITFAPTATNAASAAVSITLTKPAGASSAIPLNGSAAATTVSGNTPLANWITGGGSGTAYAITSNNGTVNVDIAGPVKTVVLTFSNDGNTNDFWISDITACVPDPGFPSSYYSTYTQPFTNQPSYFLANPQNLSVYMVNASTGVAEYIFSDPGTAGTKLNSMAYDPVNNLLYYTLDNAAQPPINKVVKKYDFNTESISTAIADITTLGIPTFIQGVEFAGASFYNGSLYLGVEECDGTSFSSNAESVIWKIDFDGSGNATTATQVFGTNGDNGSGTVTHDWGDFVIKDGTVISHATSGSATNNQYIHYNLQTGASTTYAGNAEASGQMGQTYNGNLYRIKNNIAVYNNDGSIGSTTSITTTSCSTAWSGNAGDGSDPFRPKLDFGDAPASYDPVALSPAVHQLACNNATLRIGSNWDREWSKNSSVDASGDGSDEDGISTVTVLTSDGVAHNHVQQVQVFNNTGATVTVGAWLDYDVNGVYDASEGLITTIGSNASLQTVTFTWTGLTVAVGTPNTFLRIRIVSGTGTMTTSNPTGWYSDGEVEDYPVVSSAPLLGMHGIDFNAWADHEKSVRLNWISFNQNDIDGFEIQRSDDQVNWKIIGWENANSNEVNYKFHDEEAIAGNSWYRVKLVDRNNHFQYSSIKPIFLISGENNFKIIPNPVHDNGIIRFDAKLNGVAQLRIRTLFGGIQSTRSVAIKPGENNISFDASGLKYGIYFVELQTGTNTIFKKMIKNR